MADGVEDLLDGDLDETAFGDLDGEEEDALLADDDYDSYQNTRQTVFTESTPQDHSSEIFRIVDQVQDVSEGDEIIEDGEEDVLELAVVDELDESELDNSQGNNQAWAETNQGPVKIDNGEKETVVGVTSTTSLSAIAGESDEEESDGRSTRFKTERTNVISLKGVSSGKSLSEIPDSLDNVKTSKPDTGMRPRGYMHRGGRGSIRGRLGIIQRGGIMTRGGFGPPRRPNMMPPLHQHPPPSHKIHINPHFRGGMHHQPPSVWDSERLPPPPGCESFVPPNIHPKDGNWCGPPPHHMVRPPFSPHPSFPNPQIYPPPHGQLQGYEGQYPPMMDSTQQNPTSRIVQFSENTQLITVENQHFQRPPFIQNFGPANNQFRPPQNVQPPFNSNVYPNQFNNSPRPPRFQPQYFPTPNSSPNVMGYPPHEFQSPPNQILHQNFENNQNNWNAPPQPIGNQQSQLYPPGQCVQPPTPPVFSNPEQSQPQFRPSFQNQQSSFNSSQQQPFVGGVRGLALKRPSMRQNIQSLIVPAKKKKFEHNKPKMPVTNTRSNLQEIKTVDNLPDTTVKEPEPEIEEDEETKQYRLKIAEQKALREKILKEKEARRLAAIIEKQKKQESNTNAAVPVVTTPRPHLQETNRDRGRLRTNSVKRIPKQQSQAQNVAGPNLTAPVVQIQQMLGTMYKIVKVRTKEGAIVTRKTPLVMNSAGTAATPMRTVNTSGPTQRRVVFNPPQQTSIRMVSNVRGAVRGSMVRGATNSVRMISASQTQGRTLFTVQTNPLANINKIQTPHRVVIDKRMPTMKVATTPAIPNSTLVTIDNLSLSTSQSQIQKLAKQVGNLCSFKHEPDLKRATLKFQKAKEAEQFYLKFHRKMIDLSRITVTVVPE